MALDSTERLLEVKALADHIRRKRSDDQDVAVLYNAVIGLIAIVQTDEEALRRLASLTGIDKV